MTYIKVKAPNGMHARPASQLAALANKYDAQCTLHKDKKTINIKSIMSIMGAGVKDGDKLELVVDGDDAESAKAAVVEFFKKELD